MPVEIGAIMIEDDPDQAVLRNLQAGKEAMSSMAAEQLKVSLKLFYYKDYFTRVKRSYKHLKMTGSLFFRSTHLGYRF
jgi:hypothetical protein